MFSHMMDELTVVKYQVDEIQLVIEYIVPYVTVGVETPTEKKGVATAGVATP